MRKRALMVLALASAAVAQTLTVSGPATARPGTTVPITITTTASAAVAIQWTLVLPNGYQATATIGAAGTGKSLYCGAPNPCLIFGMDVTPIDAGILAAYAVTIPADAPSGKVTIGLSGIVGADGTGSALLTTAGAAYELSVLDRSDIDGDGKTDSNDVVAMMAQITSGACLNDQNGDGKCDVLDAILVLVKALAK